MKTSKKKSMNKITKWIVAIIILSGLSYEKIVSFFSEPATKSVTNSTDSSYDAVIDFPEDKYPKTAEHIQNAIDKGRSAICTIDRDGADENRKESLAGIDTKTNYDRDEWPMAMCEEGGYNAHVDYVLSSDNRGAGSWVGHQLRDYPDGTKIKFIIE